MRPVHRSLVAQLLTLLVLTVTLVVTAGSLVSYRVTAEANQTANLRALVVDAQRRAAVDGRVFHDAARNLEQCAQMLRDRLRDPPPAPGLVRGADGAIRVAPGDPGRPLAGFLGQQAAPRDQERRACAVALGVLDELGASWCETLPAIAIAAPGRWLAAWGTTYVDLCATLLPDDPVLLRSEAELLARPGSGVRWSEPYLEPASDLTCVSALLPLDTPGGTLAIYHPVPVGDLLAQVGRDMPAGTLTAVLTRDLRPIASAGVAKPGVLPPALARALVGVEIPRTGVYPAAEEAGWLAVSHLDGPGWIVVTLLPEAVVNGTAQTSALAVLLVGGLILGVLIIAITLVVQLNIARPIRELQEDVAAMATGGRPVEPRIRRADEIGALGAAFDAMAREVAASHASLHATLAELGRREELYRTVFAAADALLLVEEGRISEANPQAARLFVLAKEDLIGQTLVALAPAQQADGGPSAVRLEQLIQGASSGFHPWRARRTDGAEIDVEIAIGRVARSGGDLLVVALHDVTERNSLDQQLRQIQKMETVGQLAGGVAHDFNNLLAGIMGSAELLGRRLGPEPRSHELVQRILQAGGRAADLVRKLMSFARKGRQVSQPLDVHEVIRETAALLERSIDRRIDVLLELTAPQRVVVGDGAMLQSALLNLGVNARDALPEGGTLTYATRGVALGADEARTLVPPLPPGNYLEILVRDTGTGMPPEVLNRLFEPFFTTKPLGKGTGLGLASVRRTVHDHHGHIGVTSIPGTGTTFRLLLPLSEEATGPGAGTQEPISGTGHILVVDDDDLVRGAVVEMLRALGYHVSEAKDGLAGIAAYQPGLHTVVLLDMEMPNGRGIDCLRALRRRDPTIRALLCSGFARDEDASALQAVGFRSFLKKPFSLYELSLAVANAAAADP